MGGLLSLRARVALRRGRLDAALAEGADPIESRELALRAGQLTQREHRETLAFSLHQTVAAADFRLVRRAYPVWRPAVREARAGLEGLAEELLLRSDVSPRGVALVVRLLSDGTGPLYCSWPDGTLDDAVAEARAAL